MNLAGRVALVTGGGQRLGRELALALGERGMQVAVHYNASADGAHEVVDHVLVKGGDAHAFQADLRDAADTEGLVPRVVERFGGLDVLVNSAAVMVRTLLGTVTAEQWDDMFALNLRAPFLLSQAAAPHLRASRGAIVNISDLSAIDTWPGYVPHGLTKAGIAHMTRSLARVLAPEVRVNAIAPGTVLLPEEWPQESADRLAVTTPLERLGTPADVVKAMLYLLDADYVTGEMLVVDGGRHVRH